MMNPHSRSSASTPPRHEERRDTSAMTERDRMERRATEVAREVGLCHKWNGQPRGRAFVNTFDAARRERYEQGVFDFDHGRIRVDARTLDVKIERTP
jgi:hypothetical protein